VLLSVPLHMASDVFNKIPEAASSIKQFLRVAELGPPNYLQLWMLGTSSVCRRVSNDGERLVSIDLTTFMSSITDAGKYCMRRCGALSLYFTILRAVLSDAKVSDHGYEFKGYAYPNFLLYQKGYIPSARCGKTSKDLFFVLSTLDLSRYPCSSELSEDCRRYTTDVYPSLPTPTPVEVPSVGRYILGSGAPGNEVEGFSMYRRNRRVAGNVFVTSSAKVNASQPLLGDDVRRNTQRFLDPERAERCRGVILPPTASNLRRFSYIDSYARVLEKSVLDNLRSRARTHYAEDAASSIIPTIMPRALSFQSGSMSYSHAGHVRVISRPFESGGLTSGLVYDFEITDVSGNIKDRFSFHQGLTHATNEYVDICCGLFGVRGKPAEMSPYLSSPRGDLSDRQLIDLVSHLSAEGLSSDEIARFIGFDPSSEMCGRYLSMSDKIVRSRIYDADLLLENVGLNDSSILANINLTSDITELFVSSVMTSSPSEQYFYSALRVYACDFFCATTALFIAYEYLSFRRSSYIAPLDITIPYFYVSFSSI